MFFIRASLQAVHVDVNQSKLNSAGATSNIIIALFVNTRKENDSWISKRAMTTESKNTMPHRSLIVINSEIRATWSEL